VIPNLYLIFIDDRFLRHIGGWQCVNQKQIINDRIFILAFCCLEAVGSWDGECFETGMIQCYRLGTLPVPCLSGLYWEEVYYGKMSVQLIWKMNS